MITVVAAACRAPAHRLLKESVAIRCSTLPARHPDCDSPACIPLAGKSTERGESVAARAMRVVCAWCKETMAGAVIDAPVTHSICPPCFEWSITHPTQVFHGGRSEALGDFYA